MYGLCLLTIPLKNKFNILTANTEQVLVRKRLFNLLFFNIPKVIVNINKNVNKNFPSPRKLPVLAKKSKMTF